MTETHTGPSSFWHSRWAAYLLAVGLTLVTLWARVTIGTRFDGPTMVVFTIPIMLSAYWGGLVPGLLATLLSTLGAAYYVLPSLFSFNVLSATQRWQEAMLVLAGTVISVVCEWLHRSHRQLTLQLATIERGRDQLKTSLTERGRVEASLRESDELFSKAFRFSPDCMVISKLADRTIVRANDAICALWGSTPETVIGKPGPDYSTWLAEEARLAFMRTLQANGECLNHETALRLANGRLMDCRLSSRMITLGGEACVLSVIRDITGQKQVAASAARLAAIVESSDDAIIGKGLDGVVTSWNASAGTLFGYSAHEMVGQPISRLIPPERQQEETHILDHVQRGESLRHFDTVRMGKGGFAIDVSITASPIKDAADTIIGVSLVARDITARKRMELALHDNEQKFRTMANSIPQLAWIARADGLIVWYNERWYEYTGMTPEQMEGSGWQRVHDPQVFSHVMEKWIGAIASGEPFEMEFPLRGVDGRFRTFLTRIQPLKDSAGRVVNWFGTSTDVEVLKQAAAAIRESEERFRFLNDLTEATRTLADPAQIMAVMARMLGEHLRASRCAYADVEKDSEWFTILHDYTDGCASTVGRYQLSLFGARAVATLYNGQTLIIRNVEAELLPEDGADMFNAIGIKAIITCPLVKDGGLRAMMAVHQTTPRDWKAGEIAIVRDVVERCWATIERRTVEEHIYQLNVELEHRVATRTAQLEASNQELEAFSYSVSHDLRAPLRAVNGFAGIVLEQFGPQLPAEARRYLDRIRDGGQRMGVLIDDLLAFSRLSRQSLSRQTVDTPLLVRHVLDDLAPQREGRHIEIQTGTLPNCWGDPALLKQVWTNLLSNAIKYSRDRESAVIEIGCGSANGEDAYFVRDNGTGFNMKYADKLFGVFQRLHRADQFEGTGVGLAIVQRIVQRHGGRVWADAEEDRGAIFRFTLATESEHARN